MKRYIQHNFLKVSHFAVHEWPHPEHNHNHIEIIFVHEGKGLHKLNGVSYAYAANSIFVLGPSDYHSFEIEEKTQFTFIKFTNIYLNGIGSITVQSNWNQYMDELLMHAGKKDAVALNREGDAATMDNLMRLVAKEWLESKNENNETLFFLIQTVLSVIKRNLVSNQYPEQTRQGDEKLTAIIQYIHNNIYSPELLHVEQLADLFGYSRNYLGIYLKEQLGITLREYINNYKLSLAENRLKYSGFTIKEISYEMGFTDLSHFNKFFRKMKGLSPNEFRTQWQPGR
ncbi:AraC family transcriptional regulator [Deminuibacter soli]|uniref:AraC family transcriptional regulator n=1 Tax=Deminuibacter soli TaxID=2291815 RepID=A0A3E1NQV1_9BACT|nr:AraC family transcriptional regulator [Deminuibacter soli]RFM30303.1 AraC family transcriptional regulator [Deminuibacter soli]